MKRVAWLLRRPGASSYLTMSLVLLAGAFLLAPLLTRTMALHMLVHIPLILSAGILMGATLHVSTWARNVFWLSVRRAVGKYNEYGVPGLLMCSFVAAYWMIPKSLDDVLLSHAADLGKYTILFLTGMVLFDSLRRGNAVIKLFFLGNFSWMTAIAGLVYQDETNRLCNFYLLTDQEVAGKGLVILAVLVPVAWLVSERARVRRLLAK